MYKIIYKFEIFYIAKELEGNLSLVSIKEG